jgi:hypothetical protein
MQRTAAGVPMLRSSMALPTHIRTGTQPPSGRSGHAGMVLQPCWRSRCRPDRRPRANCSPSSQASLGGLSNISTMPYAVRPAMADNPR